MIHQSRIWWCVVFALQTFLATSPKEGTTIRCDSPGKWCPWALSRHKITQWISMEHIFLLSNVDFQWVPTILSGSGLTLIPKWPVCSAYHPLSSLQVQVERRNRLLDEQEARVIQLGRVMILKGLVYKSIKSIKSQVLNRSVPQKKELSMARRWIWRRILRWLDYTLITIQSILWLQL